MAIEKELKLALGSAGAAAGADIDAVTRFFDMLGAEPSKTFPLGNVYFDTPSLDLARDKVALRLRRTPDGWLQTLKTAGQAKDGLHARGEWELPVQSDNLDLLALLAICDDTAAVQALKAHAPRLASVFRTDFQRTTWDLVVEGSHIEAALDLGIVHLGNGIAELASSIDPDTLPDTTTEANTDTETGPEDDADTVKSAEIPIREVELELKSGDESALWQLAKQLQEAVPGLRSDNVSKAARGYQLARAAAAALAHAPSVAAKGGGA